VSLERRNVKTHAFRVTNPPDVVVVVEVGMDYLGIKVEEQQKK
jgi:hypothetical protein